MAVRERRGGVEEVGEVELAIGQVCPFVAAEIDVDCSCALD